MLELNKCKIIETNSAHPASGVSSLEEGVALVYVLEDGEVKVQGSTGAAGERFAGFAQIRHVTPNTAVASSVSTVPTAAPYEVTLASTPRTGEIRVTIDGTAAAGTGAAAGAYGIAANVLTFDAADAGKTLEVAYRYDLTVAQANMLFGVNATSQDFGSNFSVNFVSTGDVFISNYNITDDWSDTTADIKLDADGNISTSSAAGTVLDAMVISTPAQSGGFLGIRLKP